MKIFDYYVVRYPKTGEPQIMDVSNNYYYAVETAEEEGGEVYSYIEMTDTPELRALLFADPKHKVFRYNPATHRLECVDERTMRESREIERVKRVKRVKRARMNSTERV